MGNLKFYFFNKLSWFSNVTFICTFRIISINIYFVVPINISSILINVSSIFICVGPNISLIIIFIYISSIGVGFNISFIGVSSDISSICIGPNISPVSFNHCIIWFI